MDYNNPNVPPPGYGAPNVPNPQDDVTRGKTIAILSYCTLIGWIIAIILHQSDKTKFGAYHLRQGLGLFIFVFGAVLLVMTLVWALFFLWFLVPVIQLTALVFIVLGIVNASGGKTQPLPVVGELSNKMLAGIQ